MGGVWGETATSMWRRGRQTLYVGSGIHLNWGIGGSRGDESGCDEGMEERDLVFGFCNSECPSAVSLTSSCASAVLPVHKNFT